MDNNQMILVVILVFLILRHLSKRGCKRKRDDDSQGAGLRYTLSLLSDNTRCIELLRMSRESFDRLCAHFRENYSLTDSKHVSVEEKMAMFFIMIGHNQRYVVVKHNFRHSKQTIHKFFHEVLAKMMLFAKDMIVPTSFDLNPNIPGHNRRLRRVFKGAVGALDGTLIHAIVPAAKQDLYRARGKGDCYQNVLAICDFNMIFTYIVAGWEGVAHDAKVLSEAIADPAASFPIPPPDKYYLCDAAYAHTRGFMAPYRSVRYWLGDFRRTRAVTDKEKFNHAHAKLRNVIERSFGVLKARFPILKRMAPFPLVTQRNITIACFALHNFIRKEGFNDEIFAQYADPSVSVGHNHGNASPTNEDEVGVQGSAADREYMTHLRDEIANQLMQAGNI